MRSIDPNAIDFDNTELGAQHNGFGPGCIHIIISCSLNIIPKNPPTIATLYMLFIKWSLKSKVNRNTLKHIEKKSYGLQVTHTV